MKSPREVFDAMPWWSRILLAIIFSPVIAVMGGLAIIGFFCYIVFDSSIILIDSIWQKAK